MFNSIRWRIGLPYSLMILVLMIGLGVYLSYLARQNYLTSIQDRLAAEAGLAASFLSSSLPADPVGSAGLDDLARRWSTILGVRVTIIALDGIVVGESHEDRTGMDNHATRPEVLQAIAEGRGASIRFSNTLGQEMLYLAVPTHDADLITGVVRLALPLAEVETHINQLQASLAGVTLAAILVAALLAGWLVRRTSRALIDLTDAAVQLEQGRFGQRLIPTTHDEVGRLTQAFNSMSAELNSQIKALETERSRMSAVLTVMTDGVLIVDGDGRIQLINAAAESMFGIETDSALGNSLIQTLRLYQINDLWQLALQHGESHSDTFELAGRQLYLQVIATPLGQALPGHSLLLFQNLTRLRRLETVRQDFISNISHELRTPLASLKALTETLQESALDDPPAAHRFLLRMENEVDALTQMVEELLELSRIESGRVPLKMAPTPPMDLIANAVERLHMQAQRASLQVQVHCPPGVPPVLADRTRLEQVLVNLLHNAIKFTPPGGRIDVSAEQQDEAVLFAVRDTGTGITARDLPRIFERFYKADRARSSGGTGLGLAIARHQVEAHGGQIWAESIEGQGSSFYFSIPVA